MMKTNKKTIIGNLTREDIQNEILYHFHISDIIENYKLDIYTCSDVELINIFNDIVSSKKQTVSAKDLIDNYNNKEILIDTPDGYNQLGDFYIKYGYNCYEVVTDSGRSAKVSEVHKFEINSKFNWIETKDINVGDEIYTKDGFEKIVSVNIIGDSEVYDFNVLHENHRYWTTSGISSHNCGKSFLCYNICREAQKVGYSIIYIDTEFAIELDQLPGYGLDTSEDKFMLIRNNVIEDLKIFLTQMLDNLREQKNNGVEIDKFLIVLDSVGQLGSRKEVEDAKSGKEKADFTKAKALASLFRITSSDLGDLSIPLIATNHTYKCVTGDTKVKMSDSSYKEIKDIVQGESVKTLVGDKEVNFVKKYENAAIIKVVMVDGTEIRCTPDHKFLVNENWTEDESNECWVEAQDLIITEINEQNGELKTKTNYILDNNFKSLEVKSIEYIEDKEDVYDINVQDVHHYILENGMVTHNTMDLYPQDKMKGGCVEPFHIIQTDDGLKEIQDIEKGDYVKTLTGFEEVLETHKYEKEMIDFEFENGISFKVSKNHRFLINEDHTKEESWKLATDLNVDDEIFMM